MRLLLIEDDDRVSAALRDVLQQHGFEVERAPSAQAAFALLGPDVDVVVLDLGLPDHDGFEVCARIRREYDMPIIIATARSDLASRVHGLHLGADDYLVKPYDIRELMARIHAVNRRTRPREAVSADGSGRTADHVVSVGRTVVDHDRRVVEVNGQPIALTRKEFDILALLVRTPGVVIRREQILSEVWESQWQGAERSLEVHVASIRSKVGAADIIQTVRGIGYRLGGA